MDQTPTPPAGTVRLQDGAPVSPPAGTRAAPSGGPVGSPPTTQLPTATEGGRHGRPLRRSHHYRVLSAEDPTAWSAEPGRSLLDLPEPLQLVAFERLSEGPPLAVLCDPRHAETISRLATMARSATQLPVAVLPIPAGPLARFVGARLADHLLAEPQGRSQATIVVALPDLLARLPDIGLTRSVAKLDLPGIGVRHHLASYLPGGGVFAIQLTPVPAVARLSGTRPPDPRSGIRPIDAGPAGVSLVAHGKIPPPPQLVQALGVNEQPYPVPGAPDVTAFWRSEEATELVLQPRDPVGWAAAYLPPPTAVQRCRWCGEPLASHSDSCVFCGNAGR